MDNPELSADADVDTIRLQDVVAAGRKALARIKQGSKEALLGWLDVADALRDARRFTDPDGKTLTIDQYVGVAKEIGIHNRTDALDLPRFARHRDSVLAYCYAEEAKAVARGAAYQYPGWRKAWRLFEPAEKKPPKDKPEMVDAADLAVVKAAYEQQYQVANDLATKAAKLENELESLRSENARLREQIDDMLGKAMTPAGDRIHELEAEIKKLKRRRTSKAGE